MKIRVPRKRIRDFCRKWKVTEFALFGSVLREDFGPDSDVDVMVTLSPEAPWSLYEWVDMIDELRTIFGRKVDLLERTGLRNPFRRQKILNNMKVIYDSRE